jgi:uncharacterized protein YbjT (DUF2867 family)
MKRVLIAGTTGYLGSFVVQEFKKQGFWVRALARTLEKLAPLKEFIDESYIMDVDYQGNQNLLEEALREGTAKFIFISVFNAENMKNLKGIEAKLRFEESLKRSGMQYSIIYPNGFFSDMLEYLQMAKKGRGYVFGSGENRINPIHGKDLAEVCVEAAVGDHEEIQVGGPDIFTHNEILVMAVEAVGKQKKISKIPLWVRILTVRTLRTFTSVKTYGPMEFFMTVLPADLVAPTYGTHHL